MVWHQHGSPHNLMSRQCGELPSSGLAAPLHRYNRRIYQLLASREPAEAHRVLATYLDTVERQLLDAFPTPDGGRVMRRYLSP